MKTIFITSFHQLISRNILSTPLLDLLLRDPDVRVVLLVPADKQNFFKESFSNERVFVAGVPTALSVRDILLRYVALSAVHTDALEIIREEESSRLASRLLRLAGRFRSGQALIRRVDRAITPRGRFAGLLAQYAPALVFATDIQNENDIRLAYEARGRRIPVVGMVRSWDNLTTKGMLRAIPDTLAVTSEIVKREAMTIDYVPERKVIPVGIPHYDRYIEAQRQEYKVRLVPSREEFCRIYNLDPSKKIVVFAPVGNRYIRDNRLDALVLSTLGKLDVNIIVRVPPSDYANLDAAKPQRARVAFDFVGRGSPSGEKDRKRNEMGREDDDSLIAMLAHCDVLVTGHSTITIDASIFRKPVVLIAFDQEERPFSESIRRYYQCDYYRPITESGGVRFAERRGDLNPLVERYLSNPRLEEEGRRRIAFEQAYNLNGKATERLAGVLRSFLK